MLKQKLTGSGVDATYIEDVFSTYLFTSTPSTQKITNNIDLLGKGGLVWMKNRASAGTNILTDTARGTSAGYLSSDQTSAQSGSASFLTNFYSDGFEQANITAYSYTSWTFRKQPKFFDVVTYTGNGASGRSIAHSLGSVPGCIIIKNTSAVSDWTVYHRSTGNTNYLTLNSTDASTAGSFWGSTTPTSTDFTVSAAGGHQVNYNGETYVAYIFAHDAGGFGLTGTDNVISCGSFTGLATVNLGYEPQWIMYKTSGSTNSGWLMVDNMRGFTSGNADPYLEANSSAAEQGGNDLLTITSTGFKNNLFASDTFIYIAIRRGPMKVPTDGTKVFSPVTYTGTSATSTITGVGFPLDMNITMDRATHTYNVLSDRLRGLTCDGSATQPQLRTNATDAEASIANGLNGTSSSSMDGYTLYGAYSQMNASPDTYISYNFKRAPSFFDEVCYTGTGSATTFNHNLGAVPEMILFKRRDASAQWQFYFAALGNTKSVQMPDNDKVTSSGLFNNTSPTSSVFTVGVNSPVNASGGTYVAYLAATCAGVSKVGTYTGTGTTQQINCGFAAGARFVLIKNVGVNDYAYGYYLWDSARGIIAGNDPYLLLSSTAAEVTSTDYIDPLSSGFEISSTAPAGINANGDQFVYWAIA